MINGFDPDADLANTGSFLRMQSLYEPMMRRLGLELVVVRTNLLQFLGLAIQKQAFAAFVTAPALVLGRLFSRYYVPSSYKFTLLGGFPDGSHPMFDHLLATETMETIHDGGHLTRVAKTVAISQWPETYDLLRVCFKATGVQPDRDAIANCCACEKCLRTMMTLDVAGALDNYRCFAQAPQGEQDPARGLRLSGDAGVRRGDRRLRQGGGTEGHRPEPSLRHLPQRGVQGAGPGDHARKLSAGATLATLGRHRPATQAADSANGPGPGLAVLTGAGGARQRRVRCSAQTAMNGARLRMRSNGARATVVVLTSALLLTGVAGLAIHNLGYAGMWWDEAAQFWISQGLSNYSPPFAEAQGVRDVVRMNRLENLDPGGFSVLLHAWTAFGRGLAWLRSLPFAFFVLAVAAVGLLGWRLTRSALFALAAAATPMLYPAVLYFALEIRAYSMEMAGLALGVLALVLRRERPSVARALLVGLTCAVFLSSRYSFALVTLALAGAYWQGCARRTPGRSGRGACSRFSCPRSRLRWGYGGSRSAISCCRG